MKIHSRFKDYYDYVAHQYGGGDPKLVYNRERICEPYRESNGTVVYENTVQIPVNMGDFASLLRTPHPFSKPPGNYHISYKSLVVAGRLFRIEEHTRTTKTCLNEVVKPWHCSSLEIVSMAGDENFLSWMRQHSYKPGLTHPHLFEISKLIKAPVFIIQNTEIEGKVPNLGELGFAKFMSAEQCYQEIALFLSRIREEPKPEPLSNIEKVESHGFDKKASFRHRK